MASRSNNPLSELITELSETTLSLRTLYMTGLLVDVYGLDELAPSTTHVSCLWLHHPRIRRKEDMAGFAKRSVTSYNRKESERRSKTRGLIALAFDQRNHGTRLVDEHANGSWSEGNKRHAQDMFGMISSAVLDQSGLLDAVGAYLFCGEGKEPVIDQHLVLGVSLGGHNVWQLMFAEERLCAGVSVIGCPDLMALLSDRARLSKLSTFSVSDQGKSFFGSSDFPPALVEACKKFDPKASIFGTSAIPSPSDDTANIFPARRNIAERVGGKRLLFQSGGADKLVPYRHSKPFVEWFCKAVEPLEDVKFESRVYEGVGHTFSEDMVKDAINFILDVVTSADDAAGGGGSEKEGPASSKI